MADSSSSAAIKAFGQIVEKHNFWGVSSVNPGNMLNNCVSVSIAYILGFKTVQNLWKATHGQDLPDHPLSKPEILDLLVRAKMKCNVVEYQGKTGVTAYQAFQNDLQANHYTHMTDYLKANPGNPHSPISPAVSIQMLVCYIRPDNSGHCINGVYTVGMRSDAHSSAGPFLTNLMFADYQHEGATPISTVDVTSSTYIMILYNNGPRWG